MYRNYAVIGESGVGKTRFIEGLMDQEDIIIPGLYTRRLVLDDTDVKCNIWRLDGFFKDNNRIIWNKIDVILLVINLSDTFSLVQLEQYFKSIKADSVISSHPVILVGTYKNPSPMTKKIKMDVLKLCATFKYEDIPFVEVYLEDSKQIIDAWAQIISYKK